jgi:hypothetical protein
MVDRKDRKSYQVRSYNNKTFKLQYYTYSYNINNISDNDTKEYPDIDQEDYKVVIKERADIYKKNVIDERIANIPIQTVIKFTKKYKENTHGFQSIISFPKQDIPIDPYMIGFWLGDGTVKKILIKTIKSYIIL